MFKEVFVVGYTRVIQRQAGSVCAQVLPLTHLALVATLGDLGGYVEINDRINRVGCVALNVDGGLRCFAGCQLRPMGFQSFTQRADEPDTSDPNFYFIVTQKTTLSCRG